MSLEHPVREALADLGTANPSPSYVTDLRRRLKDEMARPEPSMNSEVVMITATDSNDQVADVSRNHRPKQRLALLALVAVFMVVVGVAALWSRNSNSTSTDQSPANEPTTTVTEPTSTTTEQSSTTTEATTTVAEPTSTSVVAETLAIGNEWIDSIITNDREAFVSLHAPDIVTNDTLMSWTALVPGGIDRATLADLYFDGFDAFQASIRTDGDVIEVIECQVVGERNHMVRCGYRASLVGGDETFIVSADLSIQDGLITNVFLTGGNNPPDLMSRMVAFLRDFGTDQDVACREIGFNSLECGLHESDLLIRYLDFIQDSEGS